MDKKICNKCRQEKSIEDFGWKNKSQGRRHSWCKICSVEVSKKHYQNNKEAYKDRARDWNARNWEQNRQNILKYWESHPCVDCGEPDPACLQFDHVRGQKEQQISGMLNKNTWETILQEIEKCEVRCANCHCKRTAKQFGHYTLRWQGSSTG